MARKPIPKKIREEVYQKYNGHCAYCWCELEYKDMQVDHVISVCGNGDNNIDNLEKERKKQREDAIKINGFIRLDKSSASEIDKQIEQTYLSLQKNIKFVCTNKDLMNSMLDELDYIVYASKLYGGKHVMEELDNRYKNKLMS